MPNFIISKYITICEEIQYTLIKTGRCDVDIDKLRRIITSKINECNGDLYKMDINYIID